jgi:addiction module RelE/StbE family toxin
MSYKDEYHPKIKTDLKKQDKEVIKEIYGIHIAKILKEPFDSEKLRGSLEGFLSYHFRTNKVDYRIAYAIEEDRKIVYFIMIGKRENFYDLLKRRLP